MKREEKQKQKMIEEIESVIAGKVFNMKNKTINKMEKQILFESLGFLNMLNYSSMPFQEIKKHWEKSNLKFM